MTKSGAGFSVGAILLTLALVGCAGGDGEDAQAAGAISQSVLEDGDSDIAVNQEQADCIGEGFVDQIGVDRLKEYGILTEDLEMAEDGFEVNQMEEGDADSAAEVFVNCVDAESQFAEQMDADSDMTPEQQECVSELMDSDALKQTFSLLFQGREDEAEEALMAPVFGCMFGDFDSGSSAESGVPRNPVEVGEMISGCSWPADTAGSTDIYGNRYVSCTGLGSQDIDIRTYSGNPREQEGADPMMLRSDDDKWVILGEDFVVTIWYPDGIDPEKVAEQVGGELVPKGMQEVDDFDPGEAEANRGVAEALGPDSVGNWTKESVNAAISGSSQAVKDEVCDAMYGYIDEGPQVFYGDEYDDYTEEEQQQLLLWVVDWAYDGCPEP